MALFSSQLKSFLTKTLNDNVSDVHEIAEYLLVDNSISSSDYEYIIAGEISDNRKTRLVAKIIDQENGVVLLCDALAKSGNVYVGNLIKSYLNSNTKKAGIHMSVCSSTKDADLISFCSNSVNADVLHMPVQCESDLLSVTNNSDPQIDGRIF